MSAHWKSDHVWLSCWGAADRWWLVDGRRKTQSQSQPNDAHLSKCSIYGFIFIITWIHLAMQDLSWTRGQKGALLWWPATRMQSHCLHVLRAATCFVKGESHLEGGHRFCCSSLWVGWQFRARLLRRNESFSNALCNVLLLLSPLLLYLCKLTSLFFAPPFFHLKD